MEIPLDPKGEYLFSNPIPAAGYIEYGATSQKTCEHHVAYAIERTNINYSYFLPKIRNTMDILNLCNHSNIQKYITSTFNLKTFFFIVESDRTTIYSLIEDGNQFTEKQAAFIFSELVEAISYLHNRNIAHLDIRPENMFISHGYCKLSQFFNAKHTYDTDKIFGNYGTLNFQAPEIFKTHLFNPKKADIWACGVFLITILLGQLPFYFGSKHNNLKDEEKENLIEEQVMNFDLKQMEILFSPELFKLLQLLFEPDPDKRPTIQKIYDDPWVAEARKRTPETRKLLEEKGDSAIRMYF